MKEVVLEGSTLETVEQDMLDNWRGIRGLMDYDF